MIPTLIVRFDGTAMALVKEKDGKVEFTCKSLAEKWALENKVKFGIVFSREEVVSIMNGKKRKNLK